MALPPPKIGRQDCLPKYHRSGTSIYRKKNRHSESVPREPVYQVLCRVTCATSAPGTKTPWGCVKVHGAFFCPKTNQLCIQFHMGMIHGETTAISAEKLADGRNGKKRTAGGGTDWCIIYGCIHYKKINDIEISCPTVLDISEIKLI